MILVAVYLGQSMKELEVGVKAAGTAWAVCFDPAELPVGQCGLVEVAGLDSADADSSLLTPRTLG